LAEIGFYHLTRSTLEQALPRLLEKAVAAGHRVLVRGTDADRLELLGRSLWTHDPGSFLAHGTRADGHAERQPIYLGTGSDNPNAADLLVLVDGAGAEDLGSFVRCLDLFDGGDDAAVEGARARWRGALAVGHRCTYWQQNERGGWTRVGGQGADAAAAASPPPAPASG
jgi:DNA polymerase-3 subunit chi